MNEQVQTQGNTQMSASPQQAAMLTEYDFIVAIDASASMGETDAPGGRSRWDYMQESVGGFARDIGKIDSDGLGLVIFGGSNVESYDGVTPQRVTEVFSQRQPRGSTPLAEALQACLRLAAKADKKVFVIIFTDGVPDDKDAAAKVIRDASQRLATDDALTFLFVQVGRDQAATKYLQQLDDNLKGAKFDIVDTKTIDEAEKFATTTDLIINAIND